jgi:16S rRNA (cytosine967-C5)-methyltransferase
VQLASLLGHASELVRIIRKSPQPADAIAREYLRDRKYIGSTDRRFISGHTFHTLRILALAEAFARDHNIADPTLAAYELDLNSDWVKTQPLHVQVNTQEWLLEATRKRWPDDAHEVWRAMMSPAPVGLRVNLRRATREQVLQQLLSEGVDASPGPLSPACINVNERINILQHPLFLDGFIEIQDEGSQLIGLACGVRPGMRVLDACAGAGGKTLHLADLMNNQGAIVSRDIEWNRLKEIPKRAHRAGVTIIQTQQVDRKPEAGNRKPETGNRRVESIGFDVVLVDAPCSGMGTVRRSPMVKWRLTPEQLERHAKKQLKLLQQAAKEVKPGGTLVYATCSILPQENEDVVGSSAHSLDSHAVSQQQLDPLHSHTDGLFFASIQLGDAVNS